MKRVALTFTAEPKKSIPCDPVDFEDCETIDEVRNELIECAQEVLEWSVSVSESDLLDLWAQIQAEKDKTVLDEIEEEL